MIIGSLIFIITGLTFSIVGVYGAIESGEFMFLIFTFLGVVATLAGSGQLYGIVASGSEKRKVLRKGVTYHGKIVGYEDGMGVVVNGVPPVDVIVEFADGTETKTARIETGDYNEAKYPLGAYCDIKLLGVTFAIVPSSLSF